MLKRLITKLLNFDSVIALQMFQVLRYAILFLCGVVLVKSGWSTIAIGAYEKTLFWTSIVSFFWINGLIMTLLSNYKEKSSNSAYLFNVYFLVCVLSLFSLLLVSFINPVKDTGVSIPLFYAFIALNSSACLVEYVYLLVNKPRMILVYGMAVFIGQLLVVILVCFLNTGINVLFAFLLVLAIIKNIWMLILLKKYAVFVIQYNAIKEYIILAWPLVLAALVAGSMDYINKLIVTMRFDIGTFAIYQYGARELPLSLLVANAFSNAMLPRVANNIDSTVTEIKKRSAMLMHWLFPLSILLMIASKYLFKALYDQNYVASAGIFNIFLLLVISRLLFPQTILIGSGKQNLILRIAVLENLCNLVFAVIFVRYWGISGLAWAIVCTYIIEKILLSYWCWRSIGIMPNSYIPIKLWLIYSVSIAIVYLIL